MGTEGDAGEGERVAGDIASGEGCRDEPGAVCGEESSKPESSGGVAGHFIPDGGQLEVTLKLEARYRVC